MLLVVSILKALAEIAGLSLLGQGILYVLAGARRDQNFVYKMLQGLTLPVMKLARVITPKVVLDRHIGYVAVLLVVVVWFVSGNTKLAMCLGEHQSDPLCERIVDAYRTEAGSPSPAAKPQ
jgi:ABC-type uncharacterized transport system permease subunit